MVLVRMVFVLVTMVFVLVMMVLVTIIVVILAAAVVIIISASALDLAEAIVRHGGARQRDAGLPHGSPDECSSGRSSGAGDGRTRENRSHEIGIRHRHGLGDPPKHVTRLPTVDQDHREAGAREGPGRGGPAPDLENPDRVAVATPVEGQHDARSRQCRRGAPDTGEQRQGGRDRTKQGMGAVAVQRLGRERVVRGVEVS